MASWSLNLFFFSCAGIPEQIDECQIPDVPGIVRLCGYRTNKFFVFLYRGDPRELAFGLHYRDEFLVDHCISLQAVKFKEFAQSHAFSYEAVLIPAHIFHSIQVIHYMVDGNVLDLWVSEKKTKLPKRLVVAPHGLNFDFEFSPAGELIYGFFELHGFCGVMVLNFPQKKKTPRG